MSYCIDKLGFERVGSHEVYPDGFIPGEFINITALNQRTDIDIFTPIGKASGVLFGLLFQLGKWGFTPIKFDEWSEISPVHSQYYQLTTQQKQNLEGQIKQALVGIQTAVSDYELLDHDLRKYKEYVNYFEQLAQARKDKDEEARKKIDTTLKSIFIDQVDVSTGEGVSLKTIVSRWPTIIVDFLKLKDEDVDAKKVAQSSEYNFSEAEAYVLTTKNKLFIEWKKMFEETVKGRYERLYQLSQARKKSIQEYRNIARPYIHRYRSIRELGETLEGRETLRDSSWFKPSVQAVSIDVAEYWAIKNFFVPELHRTEKEAFVTSNVNVTKLPIPDELKRIIRDNSKDIPDNLQKQPSSPNGIEPLDKWVLYFAKEMENYYKKEKHVAVELTVNDLLEVRKKLVEMMSKSDKNWVSPYFMILQFSAFRTVMKYADGGEFEDLDFSPLKATIASQNAIFLRYLELLLKTKEDESYITDFLGETVDSRNVQDILRADYPLLFKKDDEKEPKIKEVKNKRSNKIGDIAGKSLSRLGSSFKIVQTGQYETNFVDRIASPYLKESAAALYVPVVKFIKSNAGVP